MSSADDGAGACVQGKDQHLAEPGSGPVGWGGVPILGVAPMKIPLVPVAVFGGLGAVVPHSPTSGGQR